MSFILDALKKSEQERNRQQAPTTLELPRGRQRRVTPMWMVVVLLLLLVNCALLVFMLTRKPVPAAVAVKPAAVSAPANPAAGSALPTAARPMRSLEEEAGIAAPVTGDDPLSDDSVALPPATPAESTHAAVEPLPGSNRGAPLVTRAAPSAPTVDALGGFNSLGLQELRLDLHVYAPDAANRLVFINGKRYREGDTLPEGVSVTSITPQGAVLNYRGQAFLLSR